MPDYEFSPASGDRPRSWISKQVLIVLGVCLPVILALAIWVGVLTWRQSSMGATDHVSAIVLGRCLTYTRNMHPELRNQDCKKILNTFTSAFVSKDPCNITKEDYQPLIDLVTQTVPCNKTLLWSRSKELAHQYSGIQKEMFTLEDTLLGYIADNLVWCGDPRTSEVKEEFCPYRNENCSSTATSVFWTVVSQKFAESACGTVYVMLNGSRTTAFSKASTFGSVEVFNLHPDRVHTLHAWVMHDIGGVERDSCLGSSIKELKSIVNQRNISFFCQDDYRPARFVQCVRHPEHPSCSVLM